MFERCDCPEGGGVCRKYGVAVTPRQHAYLRGKSGLTPVQEEFYVASLFGDAVPRTADPEPATKAEPGLLEKGVRFLKAVTRHAANSFRAVGDADYATRLGACEKCDRLTEDWKCLECGCHLRAKARWESEDCPLGKWPKPLKVVEPGPGCGCGMG